MPRAILRSPLLYSFQHSIWGLLDWYLRLLSSLLYGDSTWHSDRKQRERGWKEKNKDCADVLQGCALGGCRGAQLHPQCMARRLVSLWRSRSITQPDASSDWSGSIPGLNTNRHGKMSFNIEPLTQSLTTGEYHLWQRFTHFYNNNLYLYSIGHTGISNMWE